MTSRGCCSAPTTHAGGLVMAIAAGTRHATRPDRRRRPPLPPWTGEETGTNEEKRT